MALKKKVICVDIKVTGYNRIYAIKTVTIKFKPSIFSITFLLKPSFMFMNKWWYDVDFTVVVATLRIYKSSHYQKDEMWCMCKTVVCTALSLGPNSGCYISILGLCFQRAGALPSGQVHHSSWQTEKTSGRAKQLERSCASRKQGWQLPVAAIITWWTLHWWGAGRNTDS